MRLSRFHGYLLDRGLAPNTASLYCARTSAVLGALGVAFEADLGRLTDSAAVERAIFRFSPAVQCQARVALGHFRRFAGMSVAVPEAAAASLSSPESRIPADMAKAWKAVDKAVLKEEESPYLLRWIHLDLQGGATRLQLGAGKGGYVSMPRTDFQQAVAALRRWAWPVAATAGADLSVRRWAAAAPVEPGDFLAWVEAGATPTHPAGPAPSPQSLRRSPASPEIPASPEGPAATETAKAAPQWGPPVPLGPD